MANKNEAKIKFTAETGEFNESIKRANDEMSELRAELKLNEAQMENTGDTAEGLKKKHSLLEAQLKASQSKTEALNAKVEKAAEIYGENSSEVTKLKTQLANAQTAEEKIKREIDACNKELDEQAEEFDDAKESAGNFGETLKNVGGVIAKGVVAGFGAATAAVGALVKGSIEAYADYEQLIGGVETLFKDSAGEVQGYAANAYKTAGMSANEYMETVTGFSASLLQSLNGDTAAAAEKADMAITDMSDNANKMGTDLESIKTAYAGFAKGQFTLLDNLKLGYGGTQEEMKRLLEDASAISGVKYDISSYGDIVDAIHVIQTEMGITGTTAKEASTTIAGSLSSMKSSWANLTTAIASDDLPFDEYVDNFVDSVTTVASNLIPRISTALNGVVQLVDRLAPVIIDKIPSIASELLPSIISAATGLLNSIVSALPSLVDMLTTSVIPQLVSGIVEIFGALCRTLPTLLPSLIDAFVVLIVSVCNEFGNIIQPIIDVLPDLIISVVGALMSNLPILIEGLITLTLAVCSAIPQIIQALVDATPTVISMVIEGVLSCLPQIIIGLCQVVWGIVKALPQIFGSLVVGIGNIFVGIWDGIKNVFAPVGDWFKEKFGKAKESAANAWSNAKENFRTIWTGIQGVFSNVGGWFKEKFSNAKENATNAWSTAKSNFSTVKDGIVNAFSNIKEKLSAPFEKARDVIKGVADKIKGFFKGEISMPKIKTPRFSIKPSGWKIGDLLEGSIPKLSISWHAEGGILTKPTIFGMNGNSLMAGGEAGYEAILPIDRLQGYITNAVEKTMQAFNIQALAQAVEDIANRPIVLNINGRQFALATASDSDSVSGVRTTLKSRGLIVD